MAVSGMAMKAAPILWPGKKCGFVTKKISGNDDGGLANHGVMEEKGWDVNYNLEMQLKKEKCSGTLAELNKELKDRLQNLQRQSS